jgi:hypothetical protein
MARQVNAKTMYQVKKWVRKLADIALGNMP